MNDSSLFNSKLNIPVAVNIAIFLKKAFLYRAPMLVASELKSNISNTNLEKNERKLSLCFDNSYPNQINFFFSYIVNINENLNKTAEKKYYFKRV